VTTVLLADDQELVREGFRLVLAVEEGIEVVGEASDGRQACQLALQLMPDVVLMDIRMPDLDGIAATRQIAAATTAVKVLILTTFDEEQLLYDAMRAGASGFLLKESTRQQLVHAIRTVAAGDSLLAPSMLRRLVESFCRGPAPHAGLPPSLHGLTDREVDVLRLVAKGLSNGEIAGTLHVGEATVKSHLKHALRKLDLRDRVAAVVFAYESGLVEPGS
jgi:DNA-binding NarL/FixJ family response regulator